MTATSTRPSEAGPFKELRTAPRTFWRDTASRFARNKAAMVGFALIVLFLIVSAWGLFGTPPGTNRSNLATRLERPSGAHVMGTDEQGRDIFRRVVAGAPLALAVGVVSVVGGGIIGCLLGLVAGYFQRKTGAVIMRLVDALLAFPTILLALAIMATLGAGLANIVIAVGFSSIPRFARLMEAEVLATSQQDYVMAAESIGAPPFRVILLRHVLPNSLSSVMVMATLYVSGAILIGAALSFLGLGPSPPTPAWGAMITEGQTVLQSAPWVALFPGLAIMLTVLGFNLAGDGLRDALDVRLRER